MTKKLFSLTASIIFSIAVSAVENTNDSIAKAKSCFYQAKDELINMLDGKVPLNYERAVFVIENSYWGNKANYNYYEAVLDFHTSNIQKLINYNNQEENQEFKNTLTSTAEQKKERYKTALSNWAIYKYMTDTSLFLVDGTLIYLVPFTYATDDPLATNDWSNSQTFNLLNSTTNKGNCNALVSLFKIFSERLNSEAKITTAPGHTFITHKDEKNISHNVELATRSFPGTGTLETITYTTNEAVINGIAMRSLDLKQSVTQCLINLAKGYEYKFDNRDDEFIMNCSELALKYDSLNLNAMLLKLEVMEERLINAMDKNKITNVSQLKKYPALYKQEKDYESLLAKLYKLGYREMPIEEKQMIIAKIQKRDTVIITKDHTPQPFTTIKTNTKYYSVSDGLYDEMHAKKEFEQYSKTVFNTNTGKITKFVKEDNAFKYKIDPVVSAMSVEPLSIKYPNISPYVSMGNNPICFIDPDGRDLIYVNVPANKEGTKTKKILVDTKIAADVYEFAKAMNKQYGLVISSDFRDRATQERLFQARQEGKNPYIVAQPGTSNHEGGFALDFGVKTLGIKKEDGKYSAENKEKIKELAKFATKYGFQYLGAKDAVHFYINPTEKGYTKGEDIEVNSAFFIENEGNIPTYDPDKTPASDTKNTPPPPTSSSTPQYNKAVPMSTYVAPTPSFQLQIYFNTENTSGSSKAEYGGANSGSDYKLGSGDAPASTGGQSSPRFECFIVGTKILMADGSEKNIENIKIGDKILSYNIEKNQAEKDEVLLIASPIHDDVINLKFDDSTTNSNTFDHPYYVKDKGWCSYKPEQSKSKYRIDTKKLKVGDLCYKYSSGKLISTKLKSIKENIGKVQTYNISILKKNNSYFANGMLVNNESSKETNFDVIDNNDTLRVAYRVIPKDSNDYQMMLHVFKNGEALFSRAVSKNDIFKDGIPFEEKLIIKQYHFTAYEESTKELIFTLLPENPFDKKFKMEVTISIDLKGNVEVYHH